jgi:hypothetical protein
MSQVQWPKTGKPQPFVWKNFSYKGNVSVSQKPDQKIILQNIIDLNQNNIKFLQQKLDEIFNTNNDYIIESNYYWPFLHMCLVHYIL